MLIFWKAYGVFSSPILASLARFASISSAVNSKSGFGGKGGRGGNISAILDEPGVGDGSAQSDVVE